ncbi:MAG: hypothetical protein HC821_04840 [Lewinella sp.]|nr:hypothetical protein [Lewinella sp.]
MYYMGYLTLAGEADYELIFKIPNLVIQELYWEYFAQLLTQRENLPSTEDNIREAVRQLTRGNLDPFFSLVQEVLQILSNRDYQAFDEKYIKMLIIAYVLVAGAYYVPVSEREVNNDGYIDLLLLSPPNKNVERGVLF